MRSQIVEDMMARFLYMNIRFPPNFISYQNSTASPLSFLTPTVMQDLINKMAQISEEALNGSSDDSQKNADMGYSLNVYASNRVFLLNFGGTLTLFIVAFLLILIMEVARRFIPPAKTLAERSKKRKFREALDSASYSMRWNFMINQFISVYMDLMFYSLLQIYNGCDLKKGTDFLKYISGMIAAIISFIGVIALYLLSRRVYIILGKKRGQLQNGSLTEKEVDTLERFKILHSPFGSSQFRQLLYPFLLVFRCCLFGLALIMLPKISILQPLYLLISTIGVMLFLIHFRPIHSKAQHIITLLYEGAFLIASLFATILQIYNKKHLANINVRTSLSFIMISCSVFMSLLDITSMIIEII